MENLRYDTPVGTILRTALQEQNPWRDGARAGGASRSSEKEGQKYPASLLSSLLPVNPVGRDHLEAKEQRILGDVVPCSDQHNR